MSHEVGEIQDAVRLLLEVVAEASADDLREASRCLDAQAQLDRHKGQSESEALLVNVASICRLIAMERDRAARWVQP